MLMGKKAAAAALRTEMQEGRTREIPAGLALLQGVARMTAGGAAVPDAPCRMRIIRKITRKIMRTIEGKREALAEDLLAEGVAEAGILMTEAVVAEALAAELPETEVQAAEAVQIQAPEEETAWMTITCQHRKRSLILTNCRECTRRRK